MKRAFIAILWLCVTFVATFAGYRGQQIWEHNRCCLTMANSGDSSLNSGGVPGSGIQVRAFAGEQAQPAGAVDLPAGRISREQGHLLQVLQASTDGGHPNFPGPGHECTHHHAPARAASPSKPASLVTGAGTLGLLLFSAAIHPRRFTVLCIGR